MTGKLPRINANKLISVLKKLGFKITRQSGSHKIFKNEDGLRITIPYHSNRTLHPKLVNSVLKDLNLSREKFRKLLGKG